MVLLRPSSRLWYAASKFQFIQKLSQGILYYIAMGDVCCPNAVEPPTPEHQKCRRILQGLTLWLIPVAVLGLVSGDSSYIFQFFLSLFLVFFLFIGWRTFSWCIVLMFFFYSLIFLIQSVIGLAGYIQYSQLFDNKHIWQSIYLVVSTLYFVIAIPMSHYTYRIFKTHSANPFLIQPMQQQAQDPRGQEENLRPPNEERMQRNNNPFAGQGVRVG